MSVVRFYEDAWYKIEYLDITDFKFSFIAYKIIGLADEIENSEIDEKDFIKGTLTWDFEFNFQQQTIWRNEDYQKQFNILIQKIIEFGKELKIISHDSEF